MFLWSPWCAHAVRKQGRQIHTKQHRRCFFWKLVLNQLFSVNIIKPLRCLWFTSASYTLKWKVILWRRNLLNFIAMEGFESIWHPSDGLVKTYTLGGNWGQSSVFTSQKIMSFTFLRLGFNSASLAGLSCSIKCKEKTKPPLKSHAASHYLCMLPYENM